MEPKEFIINKQLMADSIELFEYSSCFVRLHKNASLPWILIIPKTDVIEYCELSETLQLKINQLGRVIGTYFKQEHGAGKINFAAIGNVVQQLHIHVIGRHSNDSLWPDVIWGNKLPNKVYLNHEINLIKAGLLALLDS